MSTNDFGGDDLSRDDGIAVQIGDDADRSDLTAHIERLTEENRRLREENEQLRTNNADAYRPQYRRLGLGMALLGAVFAVSGLLFLEARDVLFALAATGLFGGVLTYYLSNGPFLAATVCNQIYTALAANGSAITEELDLGDDRVYVPDDDGGAYLFIPSGPDTDISGPLDGPSVTHDQRGAILESTGTGLFREFDRTTSGYLTDTPAELSARLADTLVEQFELAGSVETNIGGDEETKHVTVTVSDSTLGDVGRFDHPIASFFAVGLTVSLDRPVALKDVERRDQTESEWLLRYQW